MIEEERLLHELRDNAAKHAKAKAQLEYLVHYRKSQLAILKKQYALDFDTAAAQDREARADPQYIQTLKAIRDATEKAEYLWWQLRIAQTSVEIWRSKQANQRAERAGYGA